MTTEDKFYFDRPDLINNEDSAMRLLRVLEFYDGEIDLCHYTTFDSLISILNNKTFRLTRADLLNDKCEAQLYSKNTANSLYVFSMTNSIESVAMWKMYGCTSGIKLRLKFSKPDFLQCLYNFTKDYDENSNRIPPLFGIDKNGKLFNTNKAEESLKNSSVRFAHIYYYNNKFKILSAYDKILYNFSNFDINNVGLLRGFVKYDTWEYEKENRLIIDLNNYSREYIYFPITDELIKSFEITFNPCLSLNMKDVIKEHLNKISGYSLLYNDSELEGTIDCDLLD